MPEPMQQPSQPQQPPPGAQAQQGNDQGGSPDQSQGGPQQVVDGMVAIDSAMKGMLQPLSQNKSIPSEALNALQTCIQSYQKFLSLTMKALGVQGGPDDESSEDESSEGQQDGMSAGGKNVISADQMMGGRNAKPY